MRNKFDFRNKYLFTMIFFIAIVLISGTVAWFTYQSRRSALVLTIGEIDRIRITLSPYELRISAAPVVNYSSSSDYVTVKAVNNSNESGTFNLFYQIDSIESGLNSTSMKYAVKKNSSVIATGNFSGVSAGSIKNVLTNETIPANSIVEYTVYTYLDGSAGDQSSLAGKRLVATLSASIN